jgi:hypothetical protein
MPRPEPPRGGDGHHGHGSRNAHARRAPSADEAPPVVSGSLGWLDAAPLLAVAGCILVVVFGLVFHLERYTPLVGALPMLAVIIAAIVTRTRRASTPPPVDPAAPSDRRSGREPTLEALLSHIVETRAFELARRVSGSWDGTVGSRPAKVRLSGRSRPVDEPGDHTARLLYATVSVEADEAPRLKVTRETWRTRRRKAAGLLHEVEVGDFSFDDRYLLETDEPGRARAALTPSLRAAIDRAFRELKVEALVLSRGHLVARLRLTSPHAHENIPRLLDHLASMAASFDRVALSVHFLSPSVRAVAGPGGQPRCAVCHADLSGKEHDLVACERCATVLHEGCWTDCGGCPVLGCGGKERAQTRVSES